MNEEGKQFKEKMVRLLKQMESFENDGYRYGFVIEALKKIVDEIGYYEEHEMFPDRVFRDEALKELCKVETVLDDSKPDEKKMLEEVGNVKEFIMERMRESF